MSRSKIGILCDFLDGTQRFHRDDPVYHVARRVRDSGRMKDADARFAVVRKALAPLAVMVSRDTTGKIRIHRPDTAADLYLD